MDKLPEWIKLSCTAIAPVGSVITCNPIPKNAIQDVMCLLLPNMSYSNFTQELYADGWHDDPLPSQDWSGTYKKDNDRLMVCTNEQYYKRFIEVTNKAKAKNILNKAMRIKFFREELKGAKSSLIGRKVKINWDAPVHFGAVAQAAADNVGVPAPGFYYVMDDFGVNPGVVNVNAPDEQQF